LYILFYIFYLYDEESTKLNKTNAFYYERYYTPREHSGGRRYIKSNRVMKYIKELKELKELCKANQIKLSRIIDGKRVVYKKAELITKLKRR